MDRGVSGFRLQRQILKAIIALLLVNVMNHLAWRYDDSGVSPVNDVMLVRIPPAIFSAWIFGRSDDQFIRSIFHLAGLTHALKYAPAEKRSG